MRPRSDPLALGAEVKQTGMLLRDARAVLRRIDTLTATAGAVEEPLLGDIAALRASAERLVAQLGHREQAQ